jgi:hypothetical protein
MHEDRPSPRSTPDGSEDSDAKIRPQSKVIEGQMMTLLTGPVTSEILRFFVNKRSSRDQPQRHQGLELGMKKQITS